MTNYESYEPDQSYESHLHNNKKTKKTKKEQKKFMKLLQDPLERFEMPEELRSLLGEMVEPEAKKRLMPFAILPSPHTIAQTSTSRLMRWPPARAPWGASAEG